MDNIEITFSPGKAVSLHKGITVFEALKAVDGSQDSIIAARVNGRIADLSFRLEDDCRLEAITSESKEGLKILRHSTAHIMAEGVKKIFPGVKVAIGPAIENGFYYDFDYEGTFTPEDFPKIEAKMQEIIDNDLPFRREEVSKDKAFEVFKKLGEDYKLELLKDIPDEKVSIYRQGNFIDLCRGPHVDSTKKIKAFKLTGVSGAYWRGNENQKMLQRIYGTAFFDPKELKTYLERLEEAKRRDHRKLGKELELFSVSEEAGGGLIIYHPKGAMLRTIIEDFEKKEHLRRGYHIVMGPQLLKMDLWKKSGHLEHYREFMYFTEIEGQKYGIKPMNCLAHMLIYKSKIRSYRDLPLRYFELGKVHRHEKSGVLHGLLRVREFTQDDAHIICTPEQLQSEIKGVIDFVRDVMGVFGFDYEVEVSTRPEHSIGSDEDWERATQALISSLTDYQIAYTINEGDGAFYGPKIDIKLKDVLDRRWQCATIQCDFTLPERFDLSYIGSDGQKHRPVMLHRVVIGAIERFLGILIEHYGGAFPTWLAPVQMTVLTVTERNNEYAERVYDVLTDQEFRVEKDLRHEKLGLKIREAQMQKIPYMLVIGDKEEAEQGVSPRRRDGKDLRFMKLDNFIKLIKDECQEPFMKLRSKHQLQSNQ
jgi:threonyl-tRNA synthetase